ncbi:helix-turn-helix domain-containing protein [Rugosimonospora africana]|uniref:Transcriptional regulator n=1 Tax=Rugosimonospora africana TaxID=556532 RepID=A0A8J3VPG8_9ACTN|nr:helix-turn-helix transcriptional regulator [Rugosimonospora africana]GIH13258.1 transcriptional regulator [Rugosimonospora africana]
MSVRRSPTVGRRRLGLELRRLREASGLTIEMVADRLECSSSKISRIETGHTGVTPRDVRDMLAVYGLRGPAADELVQVARDARQKGWWHLYGTVLTGAYVGLEAAASSIRSYEVQVIPGLLQTETYARNMLQAGGPGRSETEVDRRVHVRMARQSLLVQDDPLDLWVVLDETIFYRLVGGSAVMREQLNHLVRSSARPNVTIQVLPFSAGAHVAMEGSFTILGYDEPADPDVVFAENAAGGLFLEKDEELQRYHYIFDHLRATAMPPEESVAFIAARVKEL